MSVQGVVKTYDPTTGVGVVVLDSDGSEVFLRPGLAQQDRSSASSDRVSGSSSTSSPKTTSRTSPT